MVRFEFLRGHGCSPEELIKRKGSGDKQGRVKCFRCVLEAPRARRWAEIGRDIEGTGITGRSSKGPPGVLDRYFHGEAVAQWAAIHHITNLPLIGILSTNRRTRRKKSVWVSGNRCPLLGIFRSDDGNRIDDPISRWKN